MSMKGVVMFTEEDRCCYELKLCGVPVYLRVIAALIQGGVREIVCVNAPSRVKSALGDGRELNARVTYLDSAARVEGLGDAVLLEASTIIDVALVRAASTFKEDTVVLDEKSGGKVWVLRKASARLEGKSAGELPVILGELEKSSLKRVSVREIAFMDPELKREVEPLCVKIRDPLDAREVKKLLVKRAGKRLHITSRVNTVIEDRVVEMLCEHSWVTPNRVTLLVDLLAFMVAFFILQASLPLALVAAYLVGVLDGVDGKLARVRFPSKVGSLEHSFDALYEQTWYAFLAWRLFVDTGSHLPLMLGFAFLVVDTFVRHVYMQFKMTMGIPLTAYSRFDRAFAAIDGRRNVYLIYFLVSSLLGQPLCGLLAALAHALITATFYSLRALKHARNVDKASGLSRLLELSKSTRKD
ncbi:hypothetical protein [Thermofilum pendens]